MQALLGLPAGLCAVLKARLSLRIDSSATPNHREQQSLSLAGVAVVWLLVTPALIKSHSYGGKMEGITSGQKNKPFSNPVGLLGTMGTCS